MKYRIIIVVASLLAMDVAHTAQRGQKRAPAPTAPAKAAAQPAQPASRTVAAAPARRATRASKIPAGQTFADYYLELDRQQQAAIAAFMKELNKEMQRNAKFKDEFYNRVVTSLQNLQKDCIAPRNQLLSQIDQLCAAITPEIIEKLPVFLSYVSNQELINYRSNPEVTYDDEGNVIPETEGSKQWRLQYLQELLDIRNTHATLQWPPALMESVQRVEDLLSGLLNTLSNYKASYWHTTNPDELAYQVEELIRIIRGLATYGTFEKASVTVNNALKQTVNMVMRYNQLPFERAYYMGGAVFNDMTSVISALHAPNKQYTLAWMGIEPQVNDNKYFAAQFKRLCPLFKRMVMKMYPATIEDLLL